jgi:hypothetical protein
MIEFGSEAIANRSASSTHPTHNASMKTTEKKSDSNVPKPIHKIRHGAVSASIWPQQTENGMIFNVTFQRTYKDGDDWKYTGSFGRKDLLVVGLIAARAFEWIAGQSAKKQTANGSKPANDVPF